MLTFLPDRPRRLAPAEVPLLRPVTESHESPPARAAEHATSQPDPTPGPGPGPTEADSSARSAGSGGSRPAGRGRSGRAGPAALADGRRPRAAGALAPAPGLISPLPPPGPADRTG